MKKLLFLAALCLSAPVALAADIPFLKTDEAKAEEIYNKALDLEVQDKQDKALIYYKNIVTLYPDTRTAKAAREKVESLNPASSGVISRYQANADGTAKDLETGLIWMRCSVGQEWNGKTCTGEAKAFNWEEAKAIRLEFAGYTDWRLPSIEELRTLVYCSNGKPAYFNDGKPGRKEWEAQGGTSGFDWGCKGEQGKDYEEPTIVQAVFPNTRSWWVWSGSPCANTSSAWFVPFSYGSDDCTRDDGGRVRLVRSGQ